MTTPFDELVDSGHAGKPVDTILSLPPHALRGVSVADAVHLHEAFGIESVRDVAESPVFAAAAAVLATAGEPAFDPGPPLPWAALFSAAPVAHYVGHPSGRFRVDFGPVHYRGRLDGTARVLLIGQDPAANELIAHRALVGDSGQRVQGLLRKLGINRSYVMVNTFLFGVFGQYDSELAVISAEDPVRDWRHAVLDRVLATNPIEVIVAIGRAAREAIDLWDPPAGVPREAITHPGSPDDAGVTANWNPVLARLAGMLAPDPGAVADATPYGAGFAAEDHEPIPRGDLPFGVPDFIGVGSHVTRDGNDTLIVQSTAF